MRPLAILMLLALPACENPALGIGARIDGGGVTVNPTVSGNIGDVGVAVSL